MPDTRSRTEEIALLRAAIDASGLSQRAFARDVMLREPRTIERWLSGKSPIPGRVMEWLRSPEPAPWP